MIKTVCNPNMCTGCLACMNLCPKDAIEIRYDNLDRGIAAIDINKCINCGKCKEVCPSINMCEKSDIKKCYAAWTNNREDKIKCSSGGVATGLSRKFVKDGGTVYGMKFLKEKKYIELTMCSATTDEEVLEFRGSKYVQGGMGNSYKSICTLLEKGEKVLFFGTPCQVAAIKNYLKKDYLEQFYTVDIVCHGTPPKKYLQDYMRDISTEIDEVSFRGEKDYKICFYKNKKIIYEKHACIDLYFESFLKGIIFRENCYNCIYAERRRVADLTIGDFWGINRDTLKTRYDGRISEVLVNTENGKKLIQKYSDLLHLEERDILEAVNGNMQLRSPLIKGKDRFRFERNYEKYGLRYALRHTKTFYRVYIHRVYFAIKKILKKI